MDATPSMAVDDLGTVLMVWAHPDDETYLAGGLSALLTDAGHRVVCVTATRGEAGGDHGDLAALRTSELEAALEVLGVTEHHWLDHADGGCAGVDAAMAVGRVRDLVEDIRPDTVITFGPDGFTGHPDHVAVGRWTGSALEGSGTRLLHAVRREKPVDAQLDGEFGVFELGLPRTLPDHRIPLLLELDAPTLDRKVRALLAQESQTAGLVRAVGLDRFRAWVASEAFAPPD